MAKKKFFNEPFDEGTLTKLELYKKYLEEWVPVFVSKTNLITHTVNIFDFFSGAGSDSLGIKGSPMIAIDVLMSFSDYIKREDLSINLYLNDYNKDTVEVLKNKIASMNYNQNWINVHIYNNDFLSLFHELKPKMHNAGNLIFLDQFGVKSIDKNLFQEVTRLRMTDVIFFISSATFNRFAKDENITSVIEIDAQIIEVTKASQIHNLVTDAYKKFIPNDLTYYLAPFSIKKKKNVYGLIFGSGHPLGIEKFLKVCWDKDKLTGIANFDIEDTQVKMIQYSLFERELTKVELFQKKLANNILSGTLSSDKDIVAFMLNEGFLPVHTRSIISDLKKDKKISYQGRLSFSSEILYRKDKKPKNIQILK